MNTTLRYVSIFFIWLIASSALLAEDQSECYLAIENPDKIEPKIVESLSKSLLSKYVETVQSIPRAGISQDECLYQVAVKKSMDTILITISGRNLNGIGDSKSSGFDGVQQAFIKALFQPSSRRRFLKSSCHARQRASPRDYAAIRKQTRTIGIAIWNRKSSKERTFGVLFSLESIWNELIFQDVT